MQILHIRAYIFMNSGSTAPSENNSDKQRIIVWLATKVLGHSGYTVYKLFETAYDIALIYRFRQIAYRRWLLLV